jgi:hypothetical protein
MRHYKSNIFISEIKKYFTEKEKTLQIIFQSLLSLRISDSLFKNIDKNNTQYGCLQRIIVLIMFPLFEVKDISHYNESSLYQYFKCGKDVFYRFLNNENFIWRNFAYSVNKRLIKRVNKSSEHSDTQHIRCLIADDTDQPKRGKCFELLSRIYSHVSNSYNYGFKGLFLGYHDGTSFWGLDFSLHGEKGKNAEKPYGLTKKQSKERYSKKRSKNSATQTRVNEYFIEKTKSLILMVRTAIKQGIRFDYLLVDSWFTSFELVKFTVTRKIKCHFLGMVKNGTTKYEYKDKDLNFKEILNSLKHSTKMKYLKKLNCWHYSVIVDFKGIKVKLFFCRMSKRGKWHGLLTTNLDLSFEKAFEIYSTRWTIEVFFKECKQYLRLGKCESRDFDAQIAATTIVLLQYNIFSIVKRFDCYETFGALFRQAKTETREITIKEHIWLIIKELLNVISIYFDVDIDFLMLNIITDNEKFINILNPKIFKMTA